MELYWQEHKLGLQLILSTGDRTEVMGRIRRRKDDTYDVNARAFGYNPERAATGMASLDDAKAFVESFRPWDEFIGPSDLAVEPGQPVTFGEPRRDPTHRGLPALLGRRPGRGAVRCQQSSGSPPVAESEHVEDDRQDRRNLERLEGYR